MAIVGLGQSEGVKEEFSWRMVGLRCLSEAMLNKHLGKYIWSSGKRSGLEITIWYLHWHLHGLVGHDTRWSVTRKERESGTESYEIPTIRA